MVALQEVSEAESYLMKERDDSGMTKTLLCYQKSVASLKVYRLSPFSKLFLFLIFITLSYDYIMGTHQVLIPDLILLNLDCNTKNVHSTFLPLLSSQKLATYYNVLS